VSVAHNKYITHKGLNLFVLVVDLDLTCFIEKRDREKTPDDYNIIEMWL